MKLLYGDNLVCGDPTMKRLMVIADEIGFMDRPPIGPIATGGHWGLIGMQSPIRGFIPQYSTEAVKLTAFAPPPSLPETAFTSYVDADFGNPEFVTTVIDGLRNDAFAEKLFQLHGDYGSGQTGETIRQALLTDPALAGTRLTPDVDERRMFEINTPEGRINTLQYIGIELSVRLTLTMLISQHNEIPPVSDDVVFARLLAMRSSRGTYIGGSAPLAPYLGLEVVKAVIPDAALQQLQYPDILEYRRQSKDAYDAWNVEIGRLAARMDDIDFNQAKQRIPKLIAEELLPKIVEYKNEMESVRDRLFGDLVKNLVRMPAPSAAIAYFFAGNWIHAVTAFLGACAPSVVPPVVEYISGKRATNRKHAMSYLVGVSRL